MVLQGDAPLQNNVYVCRFCAYLYKKNISVHSYMFCIEKELDDWLVRRAGGHSHHKAGGQCPLQLLWLRKTVQSYPHLLPRGRRYTTLVYTGRKHSLPQSRRQQGLVIGLGHFLWYRPLFLVWYDQWGLCIAWKVYGGRYSQFLHGNPHLLKVSSHHGGRWIKQDDRGSVGGVGRRDGQLRNRERK